MNSIPTSRFARGLAIVIFLAETLALTGIVSAPALAEYPTRVIKEKVPRSTPKQATALLNTAVDYMEKHTPQQAYAAFNDPKGKFVRNDLYVFVVGLDGIMHAHGGSPKGLVGMDVTGLEDASGKLLIRDIISTAKEVGAGTIDYVWRNPATNRVENKTTQFKRVGENVVAVGSYVQRSTPEQAQDFLEKAITEVKKFGSAAAFKEFNDRHGAFVHDDLYAFVIGIEDTRFYAMGASPDLVGNNVDKLRDAEGKFIVRDMIKLATEQGSATYDYVWRNPETNKVEDKHSLIQRVGKYVIGVGYYTK
jgi:cytochrome c